MGPHVKLPDLRVPLKIVVHELFTQVGPVLHLNRSLRETYDYLVRKRDHALTDVLLQDFLAVVNASLRILLIVQVLI